MGTGKYKKCKLITCQGVFWSESGREQYCPACKLKRKRERNRIRVGGQQPLPPPKMSINDILRWANEHKQKTGVYLDYAKAREQMKKEGYPV